MKFLDMVKVYEQLEATSSGNKLREILSNFFKKVPKNEIDKVTYMTIGTIASDFEDINLGMADKMVVRAIAKSVNKENLEIAHQIDDININNEELMKYLTVVEDKIKGLEQFITTRNNELENENEKKVSQSKKNEGIRLVYSTLIQRQSPRSMIFNLRFLPNGFGYCILLEQSKIWSLQNQDLLTTLS